MPWYSLKCPKCGAEYDDVKRTIREFCEGVKCEKCGEKLEVVHKTPIPFRLLGSGWTNGSAK